MDPPNVSNTASGTTAFADHKKFAHVATRDSDQFPSLARNFKKSAKALNQ